jgi:hypothetical protein
LFVFCMFVVVFLAKHWIYFQNRNMPAFYGLWICE